VPSQVPTESSPDDKRPVQFTLRTLLLIVSGLDVSVLTCLGGGAVVWAWRRFRRRNEI